MKTLYKIPLIFLTLFLLCTPAYAQKSSLLWSTYFGGDSTTQGGGIVTDDSGDVYMGGTTYSASGIATSGAYQTMGDSINGAAFLSKFSSSGKLLWCTYLGSNDISTGLAIDKAGNIFIAGGTNSSHGIATSGAYQTYGDSADGDGFLAKFNPSGSVLWATYYGGAHGGAECLGIVADSSGDVYITGLINSNSGIASIGAYQTRNGGGGDAFLAKFNTSGNLLWGTYFGGTEVEYGYGIAIDKAENVYITGQTLSMTGIATKGAYLTLGDSISGNAFLAKFNPFGSLLWATYYGGNNFDIGWGVATDNSGNVYMTGTTQSTSGIATRGAHQTSYNGGGYDNVFLAKFTSSDSLIWGTYYGGYYESAGWGITTDSSGNAYISGYTGSGSDIATKGAYKTSYSYDYDAFLAKFSPTDNLLWATYYGGIGEDIGGFITIDKFGNVYISGSTSSNSGIATSGAYQTSFIGGTDAFLAKFSIPCSLGLSFAGADTVCQNAIELYSTPVNNANIYSWKAIGGNILSGKNKDTVTVRWNLPGNDTLWLFGTSGTCKDSAIGVIKVDSLPDAHYSVAELKGTSYLFSAKDKNLSSYNWNFGDGKTGTGDTITHKYVEDSTYSVSLKVKNNSGCTSIYDSSLNVLTGIKAVSSSLISLQIYPNPFSNILTVSYSLPKLSDVQISIVNVNGRLIAKLTDEKQISGIHHIQFDVAKYNCSTDVYYLKLVTGDGVITKKIIQIN